MNDINVEIEEIKKSLVEIQEEIRELKLIYGTVQDLEIKYQNKNRIINGIVAVVCISCISFVILFISLSTNKPMKDVNDIAMYAKPTTGSVGGVTKKEY